MDFMSKTKKEQLEEFENIWYLHYGSTKDKMMIEKFLSQAIDEAEERGRTEERANKRSRQDAWQKRMRKENRCVKCGKPAWRVGSNYCRFHLNYASKWAKKKYQKLKNKS